MNTVIIKMTDAYSHQPFINKLNTYDLVDCRSIEGTRCYCDQDACDAIRSMIESLDYHGLHFIDSGNYHYLTLFWLEKIQEDFNLILFDHHPDDQPPSFGDILSCGGWVLKAKETLPHLKNIFTFGVGEEIEPSDLPSDLPFYISIDKDVLSNTYAITDWDQGEMSLETMHSILSSIISKNTIIGVDICGECGEEPETASTVNSQTNEFLFDFFSSNL